MVASRANENATVRSARAAVAKMVPNEAAQVSILFSAVLADLPYYNQRAKAAELEKYSATRLINAVSADGESVLVAKTDEQLVGFCISELDDALIWLSWFAVHPRHRRSGIGGKLLHAVEQRARNAGAHKIWCDCRTNNESSKHTLVSHNYRPLCTTINHWHGQDFILWEKLVG
jgi:ribosomal protein S18 acetylase RimI-like enzyme